METKWIIEYWNNDLKKIECFSNKDGTWEEAPKDNVVVVYIQRLGKRPYGKEDKLYTQRKRGVDNYFFSEKDGVAYFGGWNDSGRPNTINWWYPDGKIEAKNISKRPKGIPDKIVKIGVMVSEPWATKIGISRPAKRVIKGCCNNG